MLIRGNGMRYVILTVLAAMSSTSPALAQQPTAAKVEQTATGLEFAQTIADLPRQLLKIDVMLDEMFTEIIKADPEMQEMSREYPDIKKIMIETSYPILVAEITRDTPAYQNELAQLFDANFTKAELFQVNQFWKSPAGQRMLDSAANNLNTSNISKEIAKEIKDDVLDVSESAMRRDQNATAQKAVSQLSDADLQEIGQFGLSPVGRKFVAIRPAKDKIDLKWFNKELSKEANAQMEEKLTPALIAYFKKVDDEKAKAADKQK
jgi:hypothetical protein